MAAPFRAARAMSAVDSCSTDVRIRGRQTPPTRGTGHQDRHSIDVMFGLSQQIGCHDFWIGPCVSNDHQLTRPASISIPTRPTTNAGGCHHRFRSDDDINGWKPFHHRPMRRWRAPPAHSTWSAPPPAAPNIRSSLDGVVTTTDSTPASRAVTAVMRTLDGNG